MGNETQKLINALVPKFTAFASAVGSIQICRNVLSRYHRNEALTTRHRLLAAMGLWDLLASFGWFLTTWPVPDREEIGWVVWNVGNQMTCTGQGVLAQLAIGTVGYNACLALYYLLAIRFGKKNGWIARNVEPWMHATVTIFTLTTAIVPVPLGLYNPTAWDCWIMPYPLGCKQSYQIPPNSDETTTCTRGDNARFYQLAFNYGPTWCIILFVAIAMWLVFLKVRQTEQASSRFSMRRHGVSTSRRHRLQRMAAIQGLLYVGALLVTWGFLMAVQVYWEVTGHLASSKTYTIAAILLPAQGLLNALIYFYSPMNVVQQQLNNETRRPSGFFAIQRSVFRLWIGISPSFDDNVAWTFSGDGGHPSSKKSSSSTPSGAKIQPVALDQDLNLDQDLDQDSNNEEWEESTKDVSKPGKDDSQAG